MILMALLAGVLMPFQAAINSQLGRWLQHPLQASFLSFVIGAFCLLLVNLGLGFAPIKFMKWPVPPYLFLGGLLGAFFVTASILLVSKMGALTMTALFLTGQFLASAIMDHFAFMGMESRPLTPSRWLGILLLGLGTYLVRNAK